MLSIASQSFAQEPIKPGKEHAFLKEVVGEWDVTFDGSIKGTSSYKMVHNDLWLESKLEMEMPQGQVYWTRFRFVRSYQKEVCRDLGGFHVGHTDCHGGELDAATKTMTMTGKGPDPTGKLVDYKMSTEYKDKDTHHFKCGWGI